MGSTHHSSYEKNSEINSLLEQKQYSVYQLLSNTNCFYPAEFSRQRAGSDHRLCLLNAGTDRRDLWQRDADGWIQSIQNLSEVSVNCQRIAAEDVWNVPDRQTLQNTPSHTLETTAGDIRDTRMITKHMHKLSLILLNKLYSITLGVCPIHNTLCVVQYIERDREGRCVGWVCTGHSETIREREERGCVWGVGES